MIYLQVKIETMFKNSVILACAILVLGACNRAEQAPANFREQFKRQYGMTPAEYKNSL